MANSYGAIPRDPNTTTESDGGEGGSSSRKVIIPTVIIISVLFILFVGGRSPDNAEHWPGKLNKISAVSEFPTTTAEAVDSGWTKSDEPCNPLLGEAWYWGDERGVNNSVSLYFTPEVGKVDGVLSAIEVDYYGYIEEKLIDIYFTEEKTSKDGTYRSLSLALRKGDLCNKKKPAPPGNDPYMVISPGMANTIVPAREDSPELLNNWKQGSCIIQMGYHWELDVVGGKNFTYKAENFVPVVPMYSSTDKTINGVFFQASGAKQVWAAGCPNKPNKTDPEFMKCVSKCNFWDGGPGLTQVNAPYLYMCSNFCGECQFTGAKDGMFTTMHFFFKNMTNELCPPTVPTDSQYCRSGKYPTMVETLF